MVSTKTTAEFSGHLNQHRDFKKTLNQIKPHVNPEMPREKSNEGTFAPAENKAEISNYFNYHYTSSLYD